MSTPVYNVQVPIRVGDLDPVEETSGQQARLNNLGYVARTIFARDAPMEPANLSSHKAIQFWAKGDGQTYQVMMFTKKLGYRPATQTFVAAPEWKQFTLAFSAFGVDGTDIVAIAWAAGPKTGPFQFELDNIRLQ